MAKQVHFTTKCANSARFFWGFDSRKWLPGRWKSAGNDIVLRFFSRLRRCWTFWGPSLVLLTQQPPPPAPAQLTEITIHCTQFNILLILFVPLLQLMASTATGYSHVQDTVRTPPCRIASNGVPEIIDLVAAIVPKLISVLIIANTIPTSEQRKTFSFRFVM